MCVNEGPREIKTQQQPTSTDIKTGVTVPAAQLPPRPSGQLRGRRGSPGGPLPVTAAGQGERRGWRGAHRSPPAPAGLTRRQRCNTPPPAGPLPPYLRPQGREGRSGRCRLPAQGRKGRSEPGGHRGVGAPLPGAAREATTSSATSPCPAARPLRRRCPLASPQLPGPR